MSVEWLCADNSNIHAFSNWKNEDCVEGIEELSVVFNLFLNWIYSPNRNSIKKNFDKNGTRR